MKKILCIAFSLVMMLSLCLSVAADQLTFGIEGNTSDTIDITVFAKGDLVVPDGIVYSVKIDWDNVDFTFTGLWNAEDLKYEATREGDGWSNDGKADIRVTNRSNAAVHVDAKFDDAVNARTTTAQKNGAVAELFHDEHTLASADIAGATTHTVSIEVTGEPTANSFTLATVKFIISTVDTATNG